MAMKVILTKEITNLGKPGALVTVKPGYGRNYLLPRNLAVLATDKNVRRLEHEKSGILARSAKEKSNMTAMAKKLEAIELKFTRKVGEQNKLFGSVTATNVADRLWNDAKIRVDRRKLSMDAIKRIGRYTVPVEIFGDVTAQLKLVVAPEGEELPPQDELDELEAQETAAVEEAAAAAAEADLYEDAPEETAESETPADAEAEAPAEVEAEAPAEAGAEAEVPAEAEVEVEAPAEAEVEVEARAATEPAAIEDEPAAEAVADDGDAVEQGDPEQGSPAQDDPVQDDPVQDDPVQDDSVQGADTPADDAS